MKRNMSSWFTSDFDGVLINTPNAKTSRSHVEEVGKTPPLKKMKKETKEVNNSKKNYTSWMDQYNPKNISELAVSTKKVQEIQDWFHFAIKKKRRASVLLLTGASGAGKTATVKVICKTMELEIREWVTPSDVEYFVENNYSNQNYSIKPRQSDLFSDFLQQSRYPSLMSQLSENTKQIILVEDYPNAFVREPSSFHDILESYCKQSSVPIIFICTETGDRDLNLPRTLFPQSLRDTCAIVDISFNPITLKSMQSTLKNITAMMSQNFKDTFKGLSQDCIDSIVNSSMGDIRNAIINLHFAALKDTSIIPTLAPKALPQKRSKNKGKKLTNIGCDENLNLMHGLGRVLYPKRDAESKLVHDPDIIVEQFQSQPKSFVAFLHENYPTRFSSVHDLSEASDYLSTADHLLQEWNEKDAINKYALYVSVRGLMTTNKKPQTGWNLIRGPKFIKSVKNEPERHSLLSDFNNNTNILLDYLPYCKLMKPC